MHHNLKLARHMIKSASTEEKLPLWLRALFLLVAIWYSTLWASILSILFVFVF
ncbi:MAG: hypothetical protein ACI9BD_001567 [Candidatus Marinamargulisbacteria bacterium]|jgi:hypothetical protein